MLAVCLLMASCQTDADKACAEMAKSMKDGKVDAVAKLPPSSIRRKMTSASTTCQTSPSHSTILHRKSHRAEKTLPTFPTISRSRSTAIWLYIPTMPTRLRKFSKKRIRHNSATT